MNFIQIIYTGTVSSSLSAIKSIHVHINCQKYIHGCIHVINYMYCPLLYKPNLRPHSGHVCWTSLHSFHIKGIKQQPLEIWKKKTKKKFKLNSTKVLVGVGIHTTCPSDTKLLFGEFQVHVTSAACTFPQMFMFIRYHVHVYKNAPRQHLRWAITIKQTLN